MINQLESATDKFNDLYETVLIYMPHIYANWSFGTMLLINLIDSIVIASKSIVFVISRQMWEIRVCN